MSASEKVLRLLGALTLIFALLGVSGCNPSAKLLNAGPFSGQIVDADSGKPIAGAFVGFRWGGSDWIEGHSPHLLDVLVVADAEGRYQVPWQGERLPTTGKHSIRWTQEVWAPGYVLLESGEEVGGVDVKLRLVRAASVEDALESKHRMDATLYTHLTPGNDARRDLALALYQDSYHRVCEAELPASAMARRYLEVPHRDAGNYDAFDTPARPTTMRDAHEEWMTLYRRAGWLDQSGFVADPPALDRSLLPELCRLSRYSSAPSGKSA